MVERPSLNERPLLKVYLKYFEITYMLYQMELHEPDRIGSYGLLLVR